MKKTARVIVTFNCNRSCPQCCNATMDCKPRNINFIELLEYEEICITGGEPMLIAERIIEFIHKLQYCGFKGNIWLYTAFNRVSEKWAHKRLIEEVGG